MITYTAPPDDFQEKQNKNDSVISKNESWGTDAALTIFKEFLKLLLRNSSPHFRKRDMKFSTEAVLVWLLDFLLFLWKTTHLGICWTYGKAELIHACQTCSVAKIFIFVADTAESELDSPAVCSWLSGWNKVGYFSSSYRTPGTFSVHQHRIKCHPVQMQKKKRWIWVKNEDVSYQRKRKAGKSLRSDETKKRDEVWIRNKVG